MRTIYPSIHIFCYLLRIKFVGWSCNIPSLRNLCACTTFITSPIPPVSLIFFLQDIELSKEINESFKQSSQARTKLPSGIEMSVHVLTTGYVLCIKLRHICKGLLTFRVWMMQVLANISPYGCQTSSWIKCLSGLHKKFQYASVMVFCYKVFSFFLI